jgi:Glycoside hydrolase family 44
MQRKSWLVLAACCALVLLVGGRVAKRVLSRHQTQAGAAQGVIDDTPRISSPLVVAETIYDQALSKGWQDWGWGSHQLGTGPAKVVFQGYGGIVLHHDGPLSTPFGGVAFRFKAPAAFGEFLQVSLRVRAESDDGFPTVAVRPRHVAAAEDGWSEVLIDWSELNPKQRPFDRVLIASRSLVGSEWVLLDRIVLTKGRPAQAALPTSGALRVVCDRGSRPISDLIYGGSRGDWDSGQTAQRMGGNPLTRNNWDLGAWNVGKDWFFENQTQKTTLFQDVEAAGRRRQRLAVLVPMIGWVAKDGGSSGFPRAKFPQQQAFDPYRAEAGNGVGPDGQPILQSDPTTTSIAAPPELIEKWVRKLVAADAARGFRAVHIYILDNEPSLWNVTHRDVHPKPLSYDELFDLTVRYATAIRNADPEGLIAGPAEWGWVGYQMSAVDRDAGHNKRPDRDAHGGAALVPWYLRKLAELEKSSGKRLLDLLDLHFYPAAEGIYDGAKTDPESAALRIRSTRSLWDPTYQDESWISERIRLIPLMREWVNASNPRLKLMIGEWSFGAEADISGGIAVAEALGRFGQQGLDAGFFWGEIKETWPAYWAFRAFRNFDGKGGRFLDLSIPVEETPAVSLFASRDTLTSHVVLVLVNKELTTPTTAEINLETCGRVMSSHLYRYTSGANGLEPSPSTISAHGVTANLPPASFAVLDLQLQR